MKAHSSGNSKQVESIVTNQVQCFLSGCTHVHDVRVPPCFMRPPLRGLQRVRWAPLRCTLLVHQHAPMCPTLRRKFTGVGVCSPRPAGHSEFCKYLADSLTGCVGLAANGAGPRRCTAGVTPASVRTRDRRTEARQTAPVPCAPAMADHIRASQVRRDDKLPGHPREDPLTASSGRPPERGGGGTPRRVPGSDQPQSSRAPTPILRRWGYPTVLTTRHTGREWAQREPPRPSLVELHDEKGLESEVQQRALGDTAWAAAVFPSNPLGRRRVAANVSLYDHDPVSPHAAQGRVHLGPASVNVLDDQPFAVDISRNTMEMLITHGSDLDGGADHAWVDDTGLCMWILCFRIGGPGVMAWMLVLITRGSTTQACTCGS